jgi:LysR family hydrogen peroxide-inducible transcriptional activator
MGLQALGNIEIIRALARRRHFGRAVEELGVSQPSLARSLKNLEDEPGVRQVERREGMTPTPFGSMLIDGHAELMREITLASDWT